MPLMTECDIKLQLNMQELHSGLPAMTPTSHSSLNVRLKDSRIIFIPVRSTSGNVVTSPSTTATSAPSLPVKQDLADDVKMILSARPSSAGSDGKQMKIFIKTAKVNKGTSTDFPAAVTEAESSDHKVLISTSPTGNVCKQAGADNSVFPERSSSAQGWLCARPLKSQKRPLPKTWTTGTWSDHEIKQLKENVTNYCYLHGLPDPSEVIFSMTKTQRSGFYKEISKNINRPLFSVYRRAIRMYDCRNYLGRYSEEELEQLKVLRSKLGNNWQAIAAKLGRSSASVKDRCRLLKSRAYNKGAWTEEEEEKLAAAVEHQVGSIGSAAADYSAGIAWSSVALNVGTRTEKQCRTKWLHYLNWKRNSGVSWSKTDDLQLICRLSVCGVSEEKEVDWAALARGWPAVRSPHWLRCKWRTLKYKLGTHQTSSLKEKCRALYNSTPGNVLRSTLIAVPTATTSSALPDADHGDEGASLSSAVDSKLKIKICIAASNFAEIINFEGREEEMQKKLQKLLQSAVVVTETPAGNDISQLVDLSGNITVDEEKDGSHPSCFEAGDSIEGSSYAVMSDDEASTVNNPLCLVQLGSVTAQSVSDNNDSQELVQATSISLPNTRSPICLLPFSVTAESVVDTSGSQKLSQTTSVTNARPSLSVISSSLSDGVSGCVEGMLTSDAFCVDDNTYCINANDLCGLTGSDVLVIGSEVCAVTDNCSPRRDTELVLISPDDAVVRTDTPLSAASSDAYEHGSLNLSRDDDMLDPLHVSTEEADAFASATNVLPMSLNGGVDEANNGKHCSLPVVREDRPLSSAANSIYDHKGRLIEDDDLDEPYAN